MSPRYNLQEMEMPTVECRVTVEGYDAYPEWYEHTFEDTYLDDDWDYEDTEAYDHILDHYYENEGSE